MAKKKYKVVDLFCGCGGMSLGFEKAGFKVVSSFDNWEPAINVYKANFEHPVQKLDLSDVGKSTPTSKPTRSIGYRVMPAFV